MNMPRLVYSMHLRNVPADRVRFLGAEWEQRSAAKYGQMRSEAVVMVLDNAQ
jgi:hypothetical protein